MNVIFLDIDGVMNHLGHFKRSDKHILQEFCPVAVQNLKALLKEYDAKIVVSSSWRKIKDSVDDTINEWLFSHYGLQNAVIGATPILNDSTRGAEIKCYLQHCEHPVTNFIILDDDSDMDELLPRLVHTDYHKGFCNEKLGEARRMFKKGS